MVGLVIPVYNRPKYLKQCFESLLRLEVTPDVFFIVDDCSTDIEALALIDGWSRKATTLRNSVNSGVRQSLLIGIDAAFSYGCDIVINLDSDMIVKPNFISRMVELKTRFPNNMVSGINITQRQRTGEERNPLLAIHEDYYLKKYVGGPCLAYDRQQYNSFIRPALLTVGNWDHNACIASDKAGYPIVVTKPSVAQHIGMESSMGHNNFGELPDRAEDFETEATEKISLPDVTLFGIDAHNVLGIKRAAEISQRGIEFGAVRIITERLFEGHNREQGRTNYSRFMIKELINYFATPFVLTIHSDGYVVNPKAWDNSWLQYDYIGATWGYKDNMNVGNGGFSLRSKRLCQILAYDPAITDFHPEDDKICRKYRPYLEQTYGIRFAPEEVANKFSIEAYGARAFPKGDFYSGQFGFHSLHVNFSQSDIPLDIRL